jgi:prepilin-type processing-associated H-X9-DG protein
MNQAVVLPLLFFVCSITSFGLGLMFLTHGVRTRSRTVWGGVLLVVAIFWLMLASASILYRPVTSGKSELMRCKSNLAQIGIGLSMYRDDYNGQLPSSLNVITNYIRSAKPLTCPNSPKSQGSSYFYLPRQTLTSKDILCWDSVPHEIGQRNVLFGDFHVETFDEPGFQKLYAKQAGQR